jgi:hypothetical protein
MIRQLSKQDYLSTCGVGRMKNVTEIGGAVLDVWPYVSEARRGLELSEYAFNNRLVELVYRSEDERFDHVLIPYGVNNVYLAIIVDRSERQIFGHYLLDLNEEYGVGYART